MAASQSCLKRFPRMSGKIDKRAEMCPHLRRVPTLILKYRCELFRQGALFKRLPQLHDEVPALQVICECSYRFVLMSVAGKDIEVIGSDASGAQKFESKDAAQFRKRGGP